MMIISSDRHILLFHKCICINRIELHLVVLQMCTQRIHRILQRHKPNIYLFHAYEREFSDEFSFIIIIFFFLAFSYILINNFIKVYKLTYYFDFCFQWFSFISFNDMMAIPNYYEFFFLFISLISNKFSLKKKQQHIQRRKT